MSRFLQLHLLTFFPPSNLNRDDLGRPKTAMVGGANRLRLSSQALKRAWRTSEAFQAALEHNLGKRTQRMGQEILDHLIAAGQDVKKATKIAREVAGIFGKLKKEETSTAIEQLAFISPHEKAAALELADRMAGGEKIDPKKETASVLLRADTAADIALFGRMLADNPSFNREAAAQVAHAITTHKVSIEDDYYTAVDDLKTSSEDAGAGFLGEAGFGSGVFYLYLCINRDLLKTNLGEEDDGTLAAATLGALTRAAATVAPSGKQNSFAAHARAHYILAEKGNQQPRTLAGAFAQPVTGTDIVGASIAQLKTFRNQLDKAYGAGSDAQAELVLGGDGSLEEIVTFAQKD